MHKGFLIPIGVAIVACALAVQVSAQAKPRVFEMTGNDQMKFSVMAITAKPGENITVKLKSVGTLPKIAMAHNFVLLAATTDVAAFIKAAATASPTYIPAAMKASVLAMTGLAGPGETVQVTFKAPAKPGKYPFVCTFPGHYLSGMKGDLTVK